ncbi:MAG: large-conductance mechanosensitive channel [Candidatus Brocadiaceae bacterium]|nr:large-conductance mechanosensitive channel [Candidatus Brocadiaceae bacterium]
MKTPKLTMQERQIEKELLEGTYESVSDSEFKSIADAINKRKKDTVLNIRINKQDLDNIKKKAKRLGVRYQTFISEVIHKVAM